MPSRDGTQMPSRTVSSPTLLRLNEHGQEELVRLFMNNRTHLQHLIAKRLNKLLLARMDTSDVVQEVYLRAQKKLDEYLAAPTIHPIIWLRILCRDIVAEATQKHCREKRNPSREAFLDDHEEWIEGLAASSTSVGSALSKAETIERIRKAMTRLSETNREIVEMRHTEKLTFQEIANHLEMKMETAKKRYYRAISELGQILN